MLFRESREVIKRMDPLSVIASSIALSGAISATLGAALQLAALKHHHADVKSLLDEIEDLAEAQTLILLLSRLQTALQDFEKLINTSVAIRNGTGRFRWLLQKPRLKVLRNKLGEAKSNLLLALAGTGLYALLTLG